MIHPVSRRQKYFSYKCILLKQNLFVLCMCFSCVCLCSRYLYMKIYIPVS